MATRLNAFLASVPGNGSPSPNAHDMKVAVSGMSRKSLPSLAIPERESSDDADDETNKTRDDPPEPKTPRPFRYRNQHPATPVGPKVRALAQIFDQQKLKQMQFQQQQQPTKHEDEDDGEGEGEATSSNQDEVEAKAQHPAAAATPAKLRVQRVSRRPDDDTESSPLKRISHAQQQMSASPHRRRVSTNTAVYSKMLKKQPCVDINAAVMRSFAQVAVPTLSRTQLSSNNQLDEELDNNSVPDRNALDPIELLAVCKRGDTIAVATVLELLKLATAVLRNEPNNVPIRAPFTIVGDLHGQFRDLVAIFDEHGVPSASNPFLFLGDYVDRGLASCEIVLVLLAFKLALPQHVYLLRGNHECRALSTYYGFRAECLHKYGRIVYTRMIKCFECMPLAAMIDTSDGTVLAVHGGLSPAIQRVSDINAQVNRFLEPEPSGALCDLLWADPARNSQRDAWVPNMVRGCSFTFSEQVCREFLQRNNLLAIIRAHELEEDGFREHFQHAETPDSAWPAVVTVFSAPEYCNLNHNLGATLVLPYAHAPNTRPFGIRQHVRSTRHEVAYAGDSEDAAVLQYLQDQLPFVPVDFYQLVALSRELSATLQVAAEIATPVPSSASNVLLSSSASNVLTGVAAAEPRSEDHTATQPEHHVGMGIGIIAQDDRMELASPERAWSPFSFCTQCFRRPSLSSAAARAKARAAQYEVAHSLSSASSNAPPMTVVTLTPPTKLIASTGSLPLPAPQSAELFSATQWTALRLLFAMLDVDGSGVLTDENFVVLLAEQDADAYATREELELLVDTADGDGDGRITEQDFLQFAYRAFLRWKNAPPALTKQPNNP